MTLQAGFQFSQSSLQDYIDCHRRFQLRYILRLAWPAAEAIPASENENYLRLGATFHYLIRQHQSQLPVKRLSTSIRYLQQSGGDELAQWWENYLTFLTTHQDFGTIIQPDIPMGTKRYPELSLSAPINLYRIVSKYDLLAILPSGKIIIFDWKTNRTRPKRVWLLDRVQTRIYPYLLIRAGSELNGGKPIHPEQVEMCYWFANFPTDIEQIHYSDEQFQSDTAWVRELVDQISQKGEEDFPLTHNDLHCRFCVYRSLCDRGVLPGQLEQAEGDDYEDITSIDLSFDQINEIEY